MSAIPQVERGRRATKGEFGGEVPSILNPPTGCHFHPRCPLAEGICLKQSPALEKKSGNQGQEHFVACWKS
jgi:oligopeptide/dipeptide ABC transporter ATP-binding protein